MTVWSIIDLVNYVAPLRCLRDELRPAPQTPLHIEKPNGYINHSPGEYSQTTI